MSTTSTIDAVIDSQNLDGGVLIDPAWLAAHLADPRVRVVEVDVSPTAYDDWHVEGAVLWNVYTDLKDSEYHLLDGSAFQHLLERSGIDATSTVVFYGYAPALGFWLTKLYGHTDARILDCSRDAWRHEGHPSGTGVARPAPTNYRLVEADTRLRADHVAVREAIGKDSTMLLDVRSEAEYRGERFWPSGGSEPGGRAGHVPSAVHQPIGDLFDDRGAFKPLRDLRRIFATIGEDVEGELITYCTIGGRAATAWFVLTYLLGRQHVRVYDGSWAEWGRIPEAPVDAP
jgi:thiosulfate/3-mercaptopyruvate sulfurtransferase